MNLIRNIVVVGLGVLALQRIAPAAVEFSQGMQRTVRFDQQRWALAPAAAAAPVTVRAEQGTPATVRVVCAVPAMQVAEVAWRGQPFTELSVAGAGISAEIGAPQLPVVRRILVAPLGASLRVEVNGAPVELALKDVHMAQAVMPRQAPLVKTAGARRTQLARDAAAYAADAFAPAALARVTEAGMLAGRRLVLLEINPVQYNPARQTLQVYPRLDVTVRFDGGSASKTAVSAREDMMLAGLALNHAATTTAKAGGRLLMVAPDTLLAQMQTYAAHKSSAGWTVVLTNTTGIGGATTTAIKNFIQAQYDNIATRPDAVLLVGDTAQIPVYTGVGTDNPPTDLYYGCMDGASDWAPEFPVGRFSAQTTTQLAAILDKSIYYAQAPPGAWMKTAVFMASEDNFNITEETHNWTINTYMLSNDFACDKLYCHTYSATPAQTTAAFNDGRLFGIYSGHGGELSWADGPAFSQANVNALNNVGMYPVVCSFACLTGDLEQDECFAETWQRGANKAAVVMWASSVTSYWDEDDILQKKLFVAYFDDELHQVGMATWQAKQYYLQYWGAAGDTRRYFEQYNFFGDPTLEVAQYRTATGTLLFDPAVLTTAMTLRVTVADLDLTNASAQDVHLTSSAGDSETLALVPDAQRPHVFTQALTVVYGSSAVPGNGRLEGTHGVAITGRYIDVHTQTGTVATNDTLAMVDTAAPQISNVGVRDITDRAATIVWDTDEPADGTVLLQPGARRSGASTAVQQAVTVTGLTMATRYTFDIVARDQFGYTRTNDNLGAHFSFSTKYFVAQWGDTAESAATGTWAGAANWHRSTRRPLGGAYSWYCGDDGSGQYSNSQQAILQSVPLTISNTSAQLEFSEYIATESNYDFCYLEISTNNGATWLLLRPRDAGAVGARPAVLSLMDFVPGTFSIRFRFTSDNSVVNEGWYVDDLRIGALLDNDLVLVATAVDDPAPGGDADGHAEAGERVALTATLFNGLDRAITNLTGTLVSQSAWLTVVSNAAGFGTLPSKANGMNTSPFVGVIASNAPADGALPCLLICTDAGGATWSNNVTVNVKTAYICGGTVRRADTGAAITNATVRCTGAVSTVVPTDGDGAFRMTGVPAGALTLQASAPGFITSEPLALTCPPDRTNLTVLLGHAQLACMPAQIEASAPQRINRQTFLVLSNTGLARLTFAAAVSNGTVRVAKGADVSNNYAWIDSSNLACPPYQWLDISGVGQTIALIDDAVSGMKTLLHPFPFYGMVHTALWIHSNGGVSFLTNGPTAATLNTALPTTSVPSPFLAPFWDDLNPSVGGAVYFHSTAERSVVSFVDVPHYGTTTPGTYSFQIILYPSGVALYQYKRMDGTLNSCTVGWQADARRVHATIAFDANYLAANHVIKIWSGEEWLALDQSGGSVQAGAGVALPVLLRTDNLPTGTYRGAVLVASDGGDATVPVQFTVTPSNCPPAIVAPLDHARYDLGLDTNLLFSILVNDEDAISVQYTASNMPPTATLVANTFTYTPAPEHCDLTFTCAFTVADAGEPVLTDRATVYINVVPEGCLGLLLGALALLVRARRQRAEAYQCPAAHAHRAAS